MSESPSSPNSPDESPTEKKLRDSPTTWYRSGLRSNPSAASNPDPVSPTQSTQPDAESVTIPPETASRQEAMQPPPGVPEELVDHPRYRLLELQGEGGMGAVFKAEHRMMQRIVALKVINRALVDEPKTIERFHREVRAAAKLNHPNIVAAHDADQAGGLHFLVMEFVEGEDLYQRVRQLGRLPVDQACDYIRQTSEGLQHAFEHSMVHRDIKPHNLMLTPAGVVKILDFGLAHFVSENASMANLTNANALMGTPDYMSPEQARDAHAADIRSDIYSLGYTLYYLLAGEPPFPDGSVVQKVMSHTEREHKPISAHRGDVPIELQHILARMVRKNPQERYQTPAQVAEALAGLGQETGYSANQVSHLAAASETGSAVARPPSRPDRALAIAALVLGICSLLFAWIPCLGLLTLPFSGIGLTLGGLGVAAAWGREGRRRAFPLVGAGVNLLAIAVSLLMTFVILGWGEWGTATPNGNGSNDSSRQTAPDSEPPKLTPPHLPEAPLPKPPPQR